MNAGMFGMPDGDFGERKVVRQLGRVVSGEGLPYAPQAAGLTSYAVSGSTPANTSRLIYEATGKGAARFFQCYFPTPGAQNTCYVEIDGVVVASTSIANSGSCVLVGNVTATAVSSSSGVVSAIALDYLPFTSRVAVYVTVNTTVSGGIQYAYLMEAHK